MARSENGKAVFLINIPDLTRNPNLQAAGLAGVRLPVAPLDTISIEQSVNINNSQMAKTGSVVFGGGPGLMSVSFQSIFPMEENPPWAHPPTASQPYRDLAWYDDLMRTLAANNVIFRLVISEPTGDSFFGSNGLNRLVFDKPAMISDYSVTDEEGDALWYNVSFTEYRKLSFTTVRRELGPEFHTVTGTAVNTAREIANKYRQWDVRWQNILALNPKMRQPPKNGKPGPLVENQNDPIALKTKVRLRRSNGVIDSIDDFNIGDNQTTSENAA